MGVCSVKCVCRHANVCVQRERAFVGILEIGASVCHCQTDLFSDGVQGGGCFVIQEDGRIL